MRVWISALLLCWAVWQPVSAQMTQARIVAAARAATDLSFPDKVSKLSFFSTPEMAIYKPDGEGPFPAVVLVHQCGGLRSGDWQNQSMLEWARTMVANGYVTLLLDTMGPRQVSTLCSGVRGGVNFVRGAADAHQAADHLRKLPYVDKARVGLVGFSWGGMVAAASSSATWGSTLGKGERFAAAVAFYPGCFSIQPASGSSYEIVNNDIDRPLLVLMGEKDTETPPSECLQRLAPAKTNGAPVQWHVYPNTTHCWDCKNLHNFSKVDFRGTSVVYRYDAAVLRESEQRMLEFLGKNMPGRR